MLRALVFLLLTCCASVGLAEDNLAIKFPSPDGRFALRVTGVKVDLIETSGKVLVDLGTLWVNRDDQSEREEPVLVWSPDSKWVAYGTRTIESGNTAVYFWNGMAFEEVRLPAKLPEPKLDTDKVKPKGYAVRPLRWVKPGELELSSELMGLMRDEPGHCTARIRITVTLTTPHAIVKKVGKTEASVSE